MSAEQTTEAFAFYSFRWLGHGVDLRILWHRGKVLYPAFDVLKALGQETATYATDPAANPTASRDELEHAIAWDEATLASVVSALRTPAAEAFLAWAQSRGRDVAALELARSLPAKSNVTVGPWDPAASLPVHTSDPWYSVAQTARILSRDASIDVTQKALFEWMHKAGWIDRPGSTWEPTREITVLGFLSVVPRRGVPGYPKGTPYPQLGVTPLGIKKLHQRLGGTDALDLNRLHLTLTEEGPDDQLEPHS